MKIDLSIKKGEEKSFLEIILICTNFGGE